MGNVLGVVLGVGNRPRQGRAVLEILFLLYVLRKMQLGAHNAGQYATAAAASPLTSPSDSSSSNELIVPDRALTPGLSAPSATGRNNSRRPSIASSTSSALGPVQPMSRLARLNAALKKYQPLQLILGVLIGVHVYNNLALLLGLNAPHHSMTQEPDMHYSQNFANVRWLLTGLDAATLSTLKVKIPFVRHALTFFLSIYYLIYFRRAEDQVNAFRRSMTHEAVRACWEKGSTPLLATVDRLLRKKCIIDLQLINIPSPDGHQIECRLFYNKPAEELQHEKRMLLDLPGGGFIAMSPYHHADYLSHWAQLLGVPILSVNYRKAPQFPFPCGFEDSWYVYKSIVDSNGSVLGINCGADRSEQPIKIAVAGDSAGGNLTAGITIKAILEKVRVPDGIHLIYPVLDFAGEIWKSTSLPPPNTRIKAREHKPRRKQHGQGAAADPAAGGPAQNAFPVPLSQIQPDSSLSPAHPAAHRPDSASSEQTVDPAASPPSIALAIPPPGASVSKDNLQSESTANVRLLPSPETDLHGVPQLSSRTMYAFDGVLPFKYMLLLADCYFRNGGDPVNNPFASPMAASDSILQRFPPIFAHCGSVDPLVDDVVKFARRVQTAKPDNDVYVCVIPKVSHAYLHVTKFLPEAKLAVDLSAVWLAKILEVQPDHLAQLDLDSRMRKMNIAVTNFKDLATKDSASGSSPSDASAPGSKLSSADVRALNAPLQAKL